MVEAAAAGKNTCVIRCGVFDCLTKRTYHTIMGKYIIPICIYILKVNHTTFGSTYLN